MYASVAVTGNEAIQVYGHMVKSSTPNPPPPPPPPPVFVGNLCRCAV